MISPSVKIIIPARLASTRFPGKPLISIAGLPMIEHVRRRCLLAEGVSEVCVATCDVKIQQVVESYGGKVIMTADTHVRPSERIQEAAQKLGADSVLMVQGDEPLVNPKTLTMVIRSFNKNLSEGIQVTNLVHPVSDRSEITDPNVVKVVLSAKGNILFFSRSPIPSGYTSDTFQYYKQSGIICFSAEALGKYISLNSSSLEIQESIDMLRYIENEIKIRAFVEKNETKAIDNPEHVPVIENELRTNPEQKMIYLQIK
jgi:3-deoxy-manno-octulosonate cytidylyltransferase (CMP-KDO synthetase)